MKRSKKKNQKGEITSPSLLLYIEQGFISTYKKEMF